MAFDHGFGKILPVNLLMIVGNVYLWSPIVSLWIVVPAAIVFLLFSLDKYTGMFVCVFVLPILLGIGMSQI